MYTYIRGLLVKIGIIVLQDSAALELSFNIEPFIYSYKSCNVKWYPHIPLSFWAPLCKISRKGGFSYLLTLYPSPQHTHT